MRHAKPDPTQSNPIQIPHSIPSQTNTSQYPTSIARIKLQIKLHTITNAIILKRERVLERPLALSLEHNLMRLPSNARRHHRLEQLYRIARQARDLRFGPQPVVYCYYYHWAGRGWGAGGLLCGGREGGGRV